MSLFTLLEAARYLEYKSEASARGEEPHDYTTFTQLSAGGTTVAATPANNHGNKSSTNGSHGSNQNSISNKELSSGASNVPNGINSSATTANSHTATSAGDISGGGSNSFNSASNCNGAGSSNNHVTLGGATQHHHQQPQQHHAPQHTNSNSSSSSNSPPLPLSLGAALASTAGTGPGSLALSSTGVTTSTGYRQRSGSAASRQRTDSLSSHDDSSRDPHNKQSRRSGGAGTREVHNKLEKNRRAHLKECFESLKKQLPNIQDDRKTSNLTILRSALRYIQNLKKKERDFEQQMEHLAREKISAQQRLATLRRDGSCVLPLYDNTNHSQSLTYHLHHCTTSSALSTTATSSSSALSATTTTATGATTIVTPAHGSSRHPSAAAAAAVTSVVASNATHLTTSLGNSDVQRRTLLVTTGSNERANEKLTANELKRRGSVSPDNETTTTASECGNLSDYEGDEFELTSQAGGQQQQQQQQQAPQTANNNNNSNNQHPRHHTVSTAINSMVKRERDHHHHHHHHHHHTHQSHHNHHHHHHHRLGGTKTTTTTTTTTITAPAEAVPTVAASTAPTKATATATMPAGANSGFASICAETDLPTTMRMSLPSTTTTTTTTTVGSVTISPIQDSTGNNNNNKKQDDRSNGTHTSDVTVFNNINNNIPIKGRLSHTSTKEIKSAEDCVTVDTKEECKPITISVTSGSGASVIATGPAVNPIYQQATAGLHKIARHEIKEEPVDRKVSIVGTNGGSQLSNSLGAASANQAIAFVTTSTGATTKTLAGNLEAPADSGQHLELSPTTATMAMEPPRAIFTPGNQKTVLPTYLPNTGNLATLLHAANTVSYIKASTVNSNAGAAGSPHGELTVTVSSAPMASVSAGGSMVASVVPPTMVPSIGSSMVPSMGQIPLMCKPGSVVRLAASGHLVQPLTLVQQIPTATTANGVNGGGGGLNGVAGKAGTAGSSQAAATIAQAGGHPHSTQPAAAAQLFLAQTGPASGGAYKTSGAGVATPGNGQPVTSMATVITQAAPPQPAHHHGTQIVAGVAPLGKVQLGGATATLSIKPVSQFPLISGQQFITTSSQSLKPVVVVSVPQTSTQ